MMESKGVTITTGALKDGKDVELKEDQELLVMTD